MSPEDVSRIELKLAELDGKVAATYAAVDKIRKYMLWTAIITIALVVLPAIGLVFAIPQFIGVIGSYSGL